MASVTRLYEFAFSVYDAKGAFSVISIPVGVTTGELTIGELDAVGDALEVLLDPLVKGDIRSVSVTIPLSTFGENTADADSDVEEGALFSFVADETTKRKLMRLPAFTENRIQAGTRLVDTLHADVSAFLDLFNNGVTVATKLIRAADSEKRVITGLWSAVEDFQKSRRARS